MDISFGMLLFLSGIAGSSLTLLLFIIHVLRRPATEEIIEKYSTERLMRTQKLPMESTDLLSKKTAALEGEDETEYLNNKE